MSLLSNFYLAAAKLSIICEKSLRKNKKVTDMLLYYCLSYYTVPKSKVIPRSGAGWALGGPPHRRRKKYQRRGLFFALGKDALSVLTHRAHGLTEVAVVVAAPVRKPRAEVQVVRVARAALVERRRPVVAVRTREVEV